MTPAASRTDVRPAASAERVVARVRRHARVLIVPAVLLIALAGGTAYALGVPAEPWQRAVAGAVAFVVLVVGVVLPFLAWLARRATITTRRVILRQGLFVRERQEVQHARGYDVVVRATWGQRAFGCGDVHLDTGHEHPVVLRDVPRPALVQAALHELVEREQRRLGGRRLADGPSAEDGDTIAWGGR